MRPFTHSHFFLQGDVCSLSFSPPWNLLSFTMELSLSTPHSRSDALLSHQGATFAHLDSLSSHDLVIWTDASVPFFSTEDPASLRTVHLVVLRPAFRVRKTQCEQVSPMRPAPFCKLSHGLGSINRFATSLLFFPLKLSLHFFSFFSRSLCPLLATLQRIQSSAEFLYL